MNHTNKMLSIFQLFKRSGREIKRRFAPFFLLAMCIPLSVWLGMGVVTWFHVNTHPANFGQGIWWYLILFLTALCVLWFFASLVLYICNRAHAISVALDVGVQRLAHLTWGMLIYLFLFFCLYLLIGWHPASGLLRFFVLLLGLLGILFVTIYYIFVPYLLVLTKQPATACFHDSYLYVKNHFWRTLFILLLIALNVTVMYWICALLIKLLAILLGHIYAPLYSMTFALFLVPHTLGILLIVVPLIALYVDRLSWRLALQEAAQPNPTPQPALTPVEQSVPEQPTVTQSDAPQTEPTSEKTEN